MINRRAVLVGLGYFAATLPSKAQEKAKLIVLGAGVTSPQLSAAVNSRKHEVSLKGWLLLNGAEASRTEYAELFKTLGANAGPGDGTTTFTLPTMPFELKNGQPIRGYAVCARPQADSIVGAYMPFDEDSNL